MLFQLWDATTSNLVGAWETENEALALVRDAILRHGVEYVEPFGLLVEDQDGSLQLIAEGKALADLAAPSLVRADMSGA